MFFSVVTNTQESYDEGDIIKFHEDYANVNPRFPGWNPATNMYDGFYFFIVTLYKTTNYDSFSARLQPTPIPNIADLHNHKTGALLQHDAGHCTM